MLSLSGCASLGMNALASSKTEIATQIPQAPQDAETGIQGWVAPSADRLPSTDWISEFNDTMLTALVTEAMNANTDVRQAAARLAAAEANAKSSRAGLYPSISTSNSASRSESLSNRSPDGSSFSLGATASWEVDMWGRVRNQADAGDFDAQASNADYAGTRLAIAGVTTQTWFNLIEARLQTDLAIRNVETQERALRLTKRRFDGGVSGSSDYRLARSALANARASLATRKRIQSSTTRQLEILLRRYPEDALQTRDQLPQLPLLSSAGAPRDIFLRRPDLLAAERRMYAAGLRVDIAKKNLLPRLTLSGGPSTGAGSLTRLFSLENLAASIGAGLTAPIFQGGALKADVVRNEALLRQQTEAYADIALNAYREVEDALDGEGLLSEREDALTISLREAQKAEERLEQRFSEGLASILQLLDAQGRRISTEGQLISARKERLANRVRLHLALGGGVHGQETAREKLAKPKVSLPKLAKLSPFP
ncbi:MAG: transporter [Robiginitomaculum sp.]|nr:MAG: transporter [Robiginitomaculum sp.]